MFAAGAQGWIAYGACHRAALRADPVARTTGPGFRRTRRRYDAGLGCAIGMARGLPRAVAVHTSSELPHLTCLDFEIPDATKMSTSSKLFEPYKLGPITLPNRLVMAPLTRNRAV